MPRKRIKPIVTIKPTEELVIAIPVVEESTSEPILNPDSEPIFVADIKESEEESAKATEFAHAAAVETPTKSSLISNKAAVVIVLAALAAMLILLLDSNSKINTNLEKAQAAIDQLKNRPEVIPSDNTNLDSFKKDVSQLTDEVSKLDAELNSVLIGTHAAVEKGEKALNQHEKDILRIFWILKKQRLTD